ncbi:hypothetical protein Avbf_04682, partial [Armadillidium vulgare]
VDVLQVEPLQPDDVSKCTKFNSQESLNNSDSESINRHKVRLKDGLNSLPNGTNTYQNGMTVTERNGSVMRNDSVSVNEDLRNYAYEGDGSSPGSLSSCLESCSGSFKFIEGFREVAQLLESCDFQSSSTSTEQDTSRNTVNNSLDHKRRNIRTVVSTSASPNLILENGMSISNNSEMPPVDDVPSSHIPLNQSQGTTKITNNSKSLPKNVPKNVFCTSGSSSFPNAPAGFTGT